MQGDNIAALLWVLVSTIAILGLAYWATRRMAGAAVLGRFVPSSTGQQIEALARLSVGKDQMLVVVRADRRCFLLGVTPASITALAEFTEEEAERWQSQQQEQGGGKRSFQEAFQSVLRGRR